MDNTYKYTQIEYKQDPEISEVQPKKRTIIWYDPFFEAVRKHDEIPVFSFAPLEEIRKDYKKAGYSSKEVESMIVGLSELPEYANSNRNKKSNQKD